MSREVLGASFRDPGGFVFTHQGEVYRQVNQASARDYETLFSSGLYERLTEQGLLIPHEEVSPPAETDPEHFRTLRPNRIDFISYPYEWCFGQLRDAALVTLKIQREALGFGMTLKDASAYNIQFQDGRPVLIDTLSLSVREDGQPWQGYRQFCQHFLAPLALMSYRDVRLSQLLRVHIDGIPLDLAASLLPRRAWLRPMLLLNLLFHARSQKRNAEAGEEAGARAASQQLSRGALVNLIRSLEAGVEKLSWEPGGSEWVDYDASGSYEDNALSEKKARVGDFLEILNPNTVWDLGANTGMFSRIACERGAQVVSFDVDPGAVERNYLATKANGETALLPLCLDLINPSPAIGWANRERSSLAGRGRPDAVLALALVHHLAISNNVPLDRVSGFFAELTDALIIEFVPKSDPRVKTLLATRADIFPGYTREGFESGFRRDWSIEQVVALEDSERVLYCLRRRP